MTIGFSGFDRFRKYFSAGCVEFWPTYDFHDENEIFYSASEATVLHFIGLYPLGDVRK